MAIEIAKDATGLGVTLTLGLSMQVALLIVPLVMILAWFKGIDKMTSGFQGFSVLAFFALTIVTVILTGLIGALVLQVFVIIALATFYIDTVVVFDEEPAYEGRYEEGVQENHQLDKLHAQEDNSGTNVVTGTVNNNEDIHAFLYDDIGDAQRHYDSLIDMSMVKFILQPYKCTVCQQPTSLPLPTQWSQRICTTCQTSLDSDAPLRFLHDIIGKMYAFWISMRREEHCDRIDRIIIPGLPTYIGINKGDPKHKTTLPQITDVLIHTRKGTQAAMRTLLPEQRNLLEEVLLTTKQCHISLTVFTQLFQRLVSAPDTPIATVQELSYNPKGIADVICNSHCVHIVALADARRFAVSLTDRQLGWYPLVVPWEEYRAERVGFVAPDGNGKEFVPDLGYVYARNAYRLRNPQFRLPNEPERNGTLQWIRGLELADEIVGRWEEWLVKEGVVLGI
ncbi:hypothetical protein P171DRAFT_522740 [Karstenula rhodostoma CBS 690.94]|uniref:Uncharacterized protein n=1 Tax=Karstenula rhodostoma CBS 690.94 TaxID=1392251 RepID=A0A9P4UBG4_9PLEO|nr:hypothetical protein P171DRAFT_522740 [Karstenula rhodostoma CBS 690.94]